MKVEHFLNTLKSNPDKALNYQINDRLIVAAHAHITEIKQQAITSVDCGGKKNSWNETVMQWWSAANEDDGHRVSSSKILDIFERVNHVNPIDKETELLLEYGDNNIGVAHYSLHLSSIDEDTISFELMRSQTQCKASKTCGTTVGGSCSSKNEKKEGCCA